MIKEILSELRSKIFKAEEHELIHTPVDAENEFMLIYKDLKVGELAVQHGEWTFHYSDEFKLKHDTFQALVDFPDINKEYKSKYLWPVFSYRIPGLNQPQIQRIIREENIDRYNQVDLLKRFGKRSINNPFVLLAK